MTKVSSRGVYLLLASAIGLLFLGTGIFYVFGEKPEPVNQEKEIVSNVTPQPQSVTNESLPQQTFEEVEENTALATEDTEATESSYVATTTDSIMRAITVIGCYDACEYSYQCPDDLECVAIDDVKRCVKTECELDSTCTCEASSDDNVAGVYTQSEEKTGVGGPVQETPAPTLLAQAKPATPAPIATIRPLATSSSSAKTTTKLPTAGGQEFTYLFLAIGLAAGGIGLAWRKA